MSINPIPKTIVELYEGHPERWTQRAKARTKKGDVAYSVKDDEAVKWSLDGALHLIYGYDQQYDKAHKKIEKVFDFYGFNHHSPILFNDDAGTDFDVILALAKEAKI